MILLPIQSGTVGALAHKPDKMLILHGYSTAETALTASTAEIIIRHGTNAAAEMIAAPINFALDGCGQPLFFPQPLPCPKGIFIDRVSGETTIILYVDYQ
jgi:hypothetical protein